METWPLPQSIKPSPQGTGRRRSPSRGAVAVVGWFLGWPVVLFVCLPFLTPGDPFQYYLSVAGGILWVASCAGICGWLLLTIDARSQQAVPRRSRIFPAVIVGWFFGWFPLCFVFSHLVSVIGHSYWIDIPLFILVILGTFSWLVSCYGVYDILFEMAEERWPAAKPTREVVGEILRFLFRMLLASHGHHSP
jgi:hypothetical protein